MEAFDSIKSSNCQMTEIHWEEAIVEVRADYTIQTVG